MDDLRLNLGIMRWLVNFTQRLLCPRVKIPSADSVENWLGSKGSPNILVERETCCSCRDQYHNCSMAHPTAWSLYRLSYTGSRDFCRLFKICMIVLSLFAHRLWTNSCERERGVTLTVTFLSQHSFHVLGTASNIATKLILILIDSSSFHRSELWHDCHWTSSTKNVFLNIFNLRSL
jgi:hypothetical protein